MRQLEKHIEEQHEAALRERKCARMLHASSNLNGAGRRTVDQEVIAFHFPDYSGNLAVQQNFVNFLNDIHFDVGTPLKSPEFSIAAIKATQKKSTR